MAYFHCLIGGGSSGGGYELTVTCDADFAGTTITCTDGVTTLTQTCPSASPYEVVFEIPNGGDWTISGVISGHTVSTGVNIPTSAELIAIVLQTVTIHSAKEDTISYTDIDGATQTITFASGATSKQVQIAIEPSGNSFTFTSSVAKNPDNLSQDYSKTFTITTSTTDIYLMPDAVKTLYWWGYNSDIESGTNANGWSHPSLSLAGCTFNTNNISISSASNTLGIAGTKNKIVASKIYFIVSSTGSTSDKYLVYSNIKAISESGYVQDYMEAPVSLSKATLNASSVNNGYARVQCARGSTADVKAIWYE
jgi:hypothetical protein